MNTTYTVFARASASHIRSRAASSVVVLICVLLLAVVALMAFMAAKSKTTKPGPVLPSLSHPTLKVLNGLKNPVELRFYSILDYTTVDPAIPPFAKRAAHLLDSYRNASAGRLSVLIFDSQSDSNSTAAAADGIKVFNLQKGDASFLGLAVQAGSHKETIPLLSPDFEEALEADITRAIARAVEPPASVPGLLVDSEPEPATIESVKAAVPDYASIPLDAGVRKLRETMLRELVKQGQESQATIAQAQAALQRAQQTGTPAELDAARKTLTEAERQNANRLQDIVSKSTAQIRALEKLKSTAQ